MHTMHYGALSTRVSRNVNDNRPKHYFTHYFLTIQQSIYETKCESILSNDVITLITWSRRSLGVCGCHLQTWMKPAFSLWARWLPADEWSSSWMCWTQHSLICLLKVIKSFRNMWSLWYVQCGQTQATTALLCRMSLKPEEKASATEPHMCFAQETSKERLKPPELDPSLDANKRVE